MVGIPRTLIELNSDLTAKEPALEMVGGQAGEGQAKLQEGDFDRLVVLHHEVVAEALRGAGLMRADSKLLVLDAQTGVGEKRHRVDVLMAEVGPEHEFRRLVVFEDKLIKNPEARREVIGQLIEYADELQEEDAESLTSRFEKTCSEAGWVKANSREIALSLGQGDFLLIICGDEPHPVMLRIVEKMTRHLNADPLVTYDIGVLALPIYSDGQRRFFLPQVVSVVAPPSRELKIRIVGSNEKPLDVEASVVEDARPARAPRPNATREEFFASVASTWTPERIRRFDQLVEDLKGAVAGLDVIETGQGRPQLVLKDTPMGLVRLFTMRGGEYEAEDYLHLPKKHSARTTGIVEAIGELRDFLETMEGKSSTPRGAVRVPIDSLIASQRAFIAALQAFSTFVHDQRHE